MGKMREPSARDEFQCWVHVTPDQPVEGGRLIVEGWAFHIDASSGAIPGEGVAAQVQIDIIGENGDRIARTAQVLGDLVGPR